MFEGQLYFLWQQICFQIILWPEGKKLFYGFVPLTQLKKNAYDFPYKGILAHIEDEFIMQ